LRTIKNTLDGLKVDNVFVIAVLMIVDFWEYRTFRYLAPVLADGTPVPIVQRVPIGYVTSVSTVGTLKTMHKAFVCDHLKIQAISSQSLGVKHDLGLVFESAQSFFKPQIHVFAVFLWATVNHIEFQTCIVTGSVRTS
jgi:hypothetical protein